MIDKSAQGMLTNKVRDHIAFVLCGGVRCPHGGYVLMRKRLCPSYVFAEEDVIVTPTVLLGEGIFASHVDGFRLARKMYSIPDL